MRVEYEGAWYHVMNRGRGRQKVFAGQEGYGAFLKTLAECCERFALEVHAYCLMPNHYHLLVRTPMGNLSRAMRHIDGVYTQRHNRRVGTDGPLFRGRYKAILVDRDAYLLSVSRYIHRNPIDGAHPLVKRLEDWPWSSYPAYVSAATAPAWLLQDPTFEAVGRRDRYRGYRLFVEAGVEDEVRDFYANQRATPILGDEEFRNRTLGRVPATAEVPRRQCRDFRKVDEVAGAVAAVCGVELEALRARRGGSDRGAHLARQLAMVLCRDKTGLTLREIGEWFGGIHYSAVGQNIRRLEQAMAQDPELRRRFQTVKSRLDP